MSSSRRTAKAAYNRSANQATFIAFDGPPGSGKTRRIVEDAEALTSQTVAVITYTKDAAAIVKKRAPEVISGTVYALTWPYVKEFAKQKAGVARYAANYTRRRIHHSFDPALEQYKHDAPSAKPPHRLDEAARRLHRWETGSPPFKLTNEKAEGQLKFLLPLAKWLEAGAPIPPDEQFDIVMIDEAQDMSWTELRAACALVRPGARCVPLAIRAKRSSGKRRVSSVITYRQHGSWQM